MEILLKIRGDNYILACSRVQLSHEHHQSIRIITIQINIHILASTSSRPLFPSPCHAMNGYSTYSAGREEKSLVLNEFRVLEDNGVLECKSLGCVTGRTERKGDGGTKIAGATETAFLKSERERE